MKGTRIGRLLADLQRAARKRKLSKLEIARRAGLHPNTLRHFPGWKSRTSRDRPSWNPTPSVIARMEAVLLERPQASKAAPATGCHHR